MYVQCKSQAPLTRFEAISKLLIIQLFSSICSLSRCRWFYSRVGSSKGPPNDAAVTTTAATGFDNGLADGSGWQCQKGVGVSIIKVRMNDQISYVFQLL